MLRIFKFNQSITLLALILFSNLGFAFEKNAKPIKLVFIVADDISSKNQFYSAATNFYTSAQFQNQYTVVKKPLSLVEIIHYINNQNIEKRQLSEIHIIVHGSHWSGISMPLDKNDDRVTGIALQRRIKSLNTKVKGDLYSNNISVSVHSCGLGRSKLLTNALKQLFTDSFNKSPNMIMPKGYVFYYSTKTASNKYNYHRKEIPFYEVTHHFKEGASQDISLLFKQAYPNVYIDWDKALERTNKNFLKFDSSSSVRNISLESFGYQSDIYKFKNLYSYLSKHKTIMEQLKEYKVTPKDFSWTLIKTSDPNIVKIQGTAKTYSIFDSSSISNTTP